MMWPKCATMPVLNSARAQIRTTAQGTAGRRIRRRWTIVGMNPAIVRLEEPQRETVVEKRQIIVHAAASRQRRSPLIWIVVERRSAEFGPPRLAAADQSVRETA